MTTPAWPSSLPHCFTTDSHSEEGADNVIYSEVSVGPAKARRRTTAQPWSMGGTLRMSADQYLAFQAFLRDEIADGAFSFTFPDRLGGPDLLVRITTPHKATRSGAKWNVSLVLDVMP
jgi:hypothetical protein